MPENADVVDYDTWFKKWDDLACTYIEVKGKYSIVKSQTSSSTTVDAGDINYRFFWVKILLQTLISVEIKVI